MAVYKNWFHSGAAILLICSGLAAATCGFAGGTGEPNAPYEIETEEHLLSIGSQPSLLDKYFVLVGNISLDPTLPHGRALIAPDTHKADGFQGTSFTGRFDGQGYAISSMSIQSGTGHYLGLFGRIGEGGRVCNLRLQGAAVGGGADARYVGALAGLAEGCSIAHCSASGLVGAGSDARAVGGLVGFLWHGGRIMQCSSSCRVSGSAGSASIGGLVGDNGGDIVNCYADGDVSGVDCRRVGGLVGLNGAGIYRPPFINATGYIIHCYATGEIFAAHPGTDIGGLVGADYYSYTIDSFWDVWESKTSASAGGKGLTTTQMRDRNVYLNAGWDLVGERANGTADPWRAGGGYPMLTGSAPVALAGSGTPTDPHRITAAEELGAVNYYDKRACFKLDDNVDLDGITWTEAPLYAFDDRFDGAGYAISNLTVRGYRHLGLFDALGVNGQVKDLTLENVRIEGENGSEYVAGLVGCNRGRIVNCSVVGEFGGSDGVAGLVGCNRRSGTIRQSGAAGSVTAIGGRFYLAGGLAALNEGSIVDSHTYVQVTGSPHTLGGLVGSNEGDIGGCHADGQVTGERCLGGLVGSNAGKICGSYATVDVSSMGMAPHAGSLVGANSGKIRNCYAVGAILNESGGSLCVGGLVGPTLVGDEGGFVIDCFWNTDVSGIYASAGGRGLSTPEMMDLQTYSLNGWGDDPNWVLQPGSDSPRLGWEGTPGVPIPTPNIDWFEGTGSPDDPYLVAAGEQLALIGTASVLWDKAFVLSCDVLVAGLDVPRIGLCPGTNFTGTFDGAGHAVRGLIMDTSQCAALFPVGLFGYIAPQGRVRDLVVENAAIQCGRDSSRIGILAGVNDGTIIGCSTSGSVCGGNRNECLGAMVGFNRGTITDCDSTACVSAGSGSCHVGGLVGLNNGYINQAADESPGGGDDESASGQ